MPPSKVPIDPNVQPISKVTLGAGDVIEIKFAYASQFNETQTIRPDGKIELQLIGEIVAAGKTPAELREELIDLYSYELRHPQLAVIVRSFHQRRVYVGGEVNEPGVIEMPGKLTVFQAIMQAGGFNIETAEVRDVVVVRKKNGKWTAYKVDCSDALRLKEAPSIYLQPMDIVYVPNSRIVDVNRWMQQHLWQNFPTIGFGYSL